MPGTATSSPRGPYRTGIRRREQILAGAMEVFGTSGFAGASIRAIAARVGVSHATLLQHFGSKEGLLIAVLEEWDRQAVTRSLSDVTGLDYFRRLPDVMAAHLENPGLLELFTTIAAEASNPTHPAHAFIQQRYSRNLATLATQLQHAVDNGDVAPLTPDQIEIETRLLTAVLDGIGLQWLLDPTADAVATMTVYLTRTITAWQSPTSPQA